MYLETRGGLMMSFANGDGRLVRAVCTVMMMNTTLGPNNEHMSY